jgi:very-short-patch-repair endonuclease
MLFKACMRCAYESQMRQAERALGVCPDCGSSLRRISRARPRALPSALERVFMTRLEQAERAGLDIKRPARNYRFDLSRRWQADFAWVEQRVIVEIEGGVRSGGRHVRPEGYAGDAEKYNAAALGGWLVLRYTADALQTDPQRVIDEILMAFAVQHSRR